MVVGGLLIEEWRELSAAYHEHRRPSRETTGNIVVTFGVLLEVVIAGVIARLSRKSEKIADREIAELNDRAAQAELARAKIEQRMSARALTAEDFATLINLLRPHAGKLVDIVVFDHHVVETKLFAGQISFAFISAGWKCHTYESRTAPFRIVGPSIIVAVAKDHEGEYMALADTLASAMKELNFDCLVRLSSFGFALGKEFKPGEYELTSVHPVMASGARILSPFRIQIGAKQLATFPPAKPATIQQT
jgi:hypothetical protein